MKTTRLGLRVAAALLGISRRSAHGSRLLRSCASCRETATGASTDGASWPDQPPAPVPVGLARNTAPASARAALVLEPTRRSRQRGAGETYARRRGRGTTRAPDAREARRPKCLLLPRGAPRGTARPVDLRLHSTQGADLRQRARTPARPRRRDVEHTGRRGRARRLPARSSAGTRMSSASRGRSAD